MDRFCGSCGSPVDAEVCTHCGATTREQERVVAAPRSKGLGFAPMLAIATVASVVVLVMAGVMFLGQNGLGPGTSSTAEIGSCWAASEGDDSFDPVSCDDSKATFRITSHVDDPAECSEEGYFEDEAGAFCVESVSHG